MPVRTTDSENVFFTLTFLTDDDGDDERWRKSLLKSEFMLFPSSLLLFLVVQLIKCKWIFLELNPKGLCLCKKNWNRKSFSWLKSSTRREIRQFLVVVVLLRHKKVQKAWFACIVVVLIMQIAFLTFLLPLPIWALSTLIHRSIRVHITGVLMRFRLSRHYRSKTVELLIVTYVEL